jgi:hypothetical protein
VKSMKKCSNGFSALTSAAFATVGVVASRGAMAADSHHHPDAAVDLSGVAQQPSVLALVVVAIAGVRAGYQARDQRSKQLCSLVALLLISGLCAMLGDEAVASYWTRKQSMMTNVTMLER